MAKWLRILGYDTIVHTGDVNRDFLRKAAGEERIALTRKKDMAKRQFSGRLVVVHHDKVDEQLREIMDKLAFQPEPERMFSICVKCNEALIEVEKEKISGIVPDYVFASHNEFHMCPRCKGVYWPGTHIENAHRYLRTHIPNYRP